MIATLARMQRWEWVPLTVIVPYVIYLALDAFVPVVWMSGTLVERTDASIVVAMKGWKFRECRFHGVQAYSVDRDGYRHSANARRIDRPETKTSHPRGKYDIGRWDVRPLIGDAAVVVYAHHACDGDDLRMTKMAEVRLP